MKKIVWLAYVVTLAGCAEQMAREQCSAAHAQHSPEYIQCYQKVVIKEQRRLSNLKAELDKNACVYSSTNQGMPESQARLGCVLSEKMQRGEYVSPESVNTYHSLEQQRLLQEQNKTLKDIDSQLFMLRTTR